MSRTLRVHPGTGRVASWRGLELSEPTDLPPNVMFDAERCLAAIVPDGYEKGNVYWHRFEDEQLENLEVLDLVFQISGTPEAAEAACMVIGAYLKKKEPIFAAIAVLEILVLAFAASGIVGGGGH